MQTDFIICPMLYAIAMGQIKMQNFIEREHTCHILAEAGPLTLFSYIGARILIYTWSLVYLHLRIHVLAIECVIFSGCLAGYYGAGCQLQCNCAANASCDAVTGSCRCLPGRTGQLCQQGRGSTVPSRYSTVIRF